jgi:outer membrane immunogenic protein
MKKIILVTFIICTSSIIFAQSALLKGRNQLNFGIGFSGWGLPVYLGLDHAISNEVTLGGEISFRVFNEDYRNNKYRHNIIGISGNANYHFNKVLLIPSKYDLYAGVNVGFYSWSSPNGYAGDYNSGLGIGAQIGGRISISSKTSLNIEAGGGNAFSGGKIGLTFKL